MAASFNEIMKNLDNYRGHKKTAKPLTKQQIEFLKKCRDHECPVPFTEVAKLWKQLGWSNYSASALRLKYLALDSK